MYACSIVLLLLASRLGLSEPLPFSFLQPQQPLRPSLESTAQQPLSENTIVPAYNAPSKQFIPSPEQSYPPLFAPPLSTSGRDILDANNTRFKLASINWHGGSDELFVPSGLDIQHRSSIAHTIRQLGFNSVRLPYSDELVYSNPTIPPYLLAANADLLSGENENEIHALDVFHAIVDALTDAGLAVIINNHITSATGCCGPNPCDSAWYNDHLLGLCRVPQTEESWIANWETIMAPHVDNSLVIGADLRNEVRGVWGTMSWSKWARAAERAGDRLLRMNPAWLVFVSGTGSGNFLDEVKSRPVELVVPNKVVYEAHVYSWSGWGSWEGTYGQRDYDSFKKSMDENWGHLLKESVAPVWVGEFGVSGEPSEKDQRYWGHLMRYLKEVDADWAYWALNPERPTENEREAYGLLRDDWETAVVDHRMTDLLDIMPHSS